MKNIIVILLVLCFSISSSFADDPDPTELWRTLIFGNDQIKASEQDGELLIMQLFGEHAGWGAKRINDGEMYEVEFFTILPMPKLFLTATEYTLFRDIHILPENLEDEFMLIPYGMQNPTDYYEILIDIDTFYYLKLTLINVNGVELYSYEVATSGINIPLVYLTQAQYDLVISELYRTTTVLRFDELE